jgi:hypothetical protein
MKRNYVKATHLMMSAACQAGRKVAFTIGAATAIGGAMLLTACDPDKEETPNSNPTDVFTPPDMSDRGEYTPTAADGNGETLIRNAEAALKAAQKGAVWTKFGSGKEGDYSFTAGEDVTQWDVAAKKKKETYSVTISGASRLLFLEYTDGDKEYRYDGEKKEKEEYELQRPSTNADKYYTYVYDYIDGRDENNYTYTYEIKDGKIVVKGTRSSDEPVTYEVTLDKDKRYKQVTRKKKVHCNGGGYSSNGQTYTCEDGSDYNKLTDEVRETYFAYDVAAFGLPSGMSASQFPDKTGEYLSATANWGEGKGTSTVWEQKCEYYGGSSGCTTSLPYSEIEWYAPFDDKVIDKIKVGGKTYCSDYQYGGTNAGCDGNLYEIPFTEGMVISFEWKAGTPRPH